MGDGFREGSAESEDIEVFSVKGTRWMGGYTAELENRKKENRQLYHNIFPHHIYPH